MRKADVLVVGAGMAGASLGAEAAALGLDVLLIEMESQPGYHATGRSVAFWTESYGGPDIQPLTSASGPMLEALGVLRRRGAVHVGGEAARLARDAMLAAFPDVGLRALDRAALEARLPWLRPEWTIGLEEPSCSDIDVAALHGHYLKVLKANGGAVLADAALLSARREGAGWRAETRAGVIACGRIVNAAGAWADAVAERCGVPPIGIQPLRRTVVQVATDPAATSDEPLVLDLNGRFYFKPAANGRLWLTPHDEVPSPPCDAAPEEIAVAEAVARYGEVSTRQVTTVEHRWAGLRSFAPDRRPVYGEEADHPGFFWFAGQGGFGIQTAPAAALIGAGMLAGAPLENSLSAIETEAYSVMRLR